MTEQSPNAAPALLPAPIAQDAPVPKTVNNPWQVVSGVLAAACGLAAIWAHVFGEDNIAAGFTASAGFLGGFCGGHLKGSQNPQ